jgi:tetratricopeptide (TPR) repeat protein
MSKVILKQKIEKLVNHFHAGRYSFVIRESKLLLKKLPENPFLYNLIASCHQYLNDLEAAKKIFIYVLQLDPKNISAYNNLGNVYKNLKKFKMAEENYERALKINPNYINTIVNYGSLKYELNDHNEAIKFFNRALDLNNEVPIAHYNLGLVYQSLGKFDKARHHLQMLLKINPKATMADKILSRITKYKAGDSHIHEMKDKLDKVSLTEMEKINIFFALGKAYEDLNDYEKSFYYLKKGNHTKKKLLNYNISKDLEIFDVLKKFFTNYDFKKTNLTTSKKKILFIVGMPRSGTSLVEQILSSHSSVYGAGELPYLTNIIQSEFYENKTLNLNKLLELNNEKKLQHIADRYASLTTNDKAPLNFLWLGLIKLIFPSSKIIHCTRSPKDNCLSLYKNVFDDNLNWTYDEADLLKFYQKYSALMGFWKQNIPNFIYDMNYEKLILNARGEIKNLLNFCDLDWEQDCLDFHNNKRPIKTVSSTQARQSIYNSSIDSSKNYEKFLPILFSSLDSL